MNETELLATLQVVFVLLVAVLVFSLICTVVVAIREYHRTRVVRHSAKHSRGTEVPVSNMVVPKSTAGGATGGVEYTPNAPQVTSAKEATQSTPQATAVKEDAQSTPPVAESHSEEPKQTWSQPTGYSHAPRKRHARHGR